MASSEFRAEEGRTKPICAECGSDSIYADATATWDEMARAWITEGPVGMMHCQGCGASPAKTNIVQIINGAAPPVFRSVRTPGAFGFGGEGAA